MVWITADLSEDLTVEVGWDTAHIIVHSRQNRDRLFGHIHARKDARTFRNTRQALRQNVWVQMI